MRDARSTGAPATASTDAIALAYAIAKYYPTPALTNSSLIELLATASTLEEPGSTRARALRRAARAALTWPDEAAALLDAGRPLTELRMVGPWVAQVVTAMIEQNAPPPVVDPLRDDFLTAAEMHATLADHAGAAMLRCDLQMHTTWSDGHSSLEDMVTSAAARGYTHIAITDHSKGLTIANGLDERRLAEQAEAIARANHGPAGSMRVLRSMEVNLAPDGTVDMDHAELAGLDIVLGAFHSKLRLRDDQTDRYIAALHNPDVHILGHPRGRMYGHRLGLTADWAAVFSAAARLDKAVEVDGYIARQDLNVALLEVARECGVRISIGSDAHHVSDLTYADYARAAVIRARIPEERIINCLSLGQLREWVAGLRDA